MSAVYRRAGEAASTNPTKHTLPVAVPGTGTATGRTRRPERIGSGAGDGLGGLGLHVLATHLIEDDWVPGGLAALADHVVLPGPPAELELLDEIHFRTHT